MHRRTLFAGAAGVAAAIALPGTANAGPNTAGGPAFPEVIDLPDGWQPEGIATGRGTTFYVGSLADGAVYRGSLATGRGATFVAGAAGKQALGLEHDHRGRLWVAGAGGGGATVYDGDSGRVLAEYAFGGTFVNDVVVTGRAAYFTDSYQPVLYEVPLGPLGRLPGQSAVRTIPLPGGLGDADGFNNGIEATPDGRLLVVQMLADRLFAFDPRRGTATQVDLGGASVLQGDGLLLRGPHLYVVRNFFNVIAKFRLGHDLRAATLVEEITHPKFDIPATVAGFGGSLYAVNARFNLPAPAPTDTYSIVRVPA
ncbi:superoxide dismutase [Dactylosporangium siamense]|uniref:Superoxide dismutase n=1 Tax=Dactylosporangium siamense TaxID=685454 RepID=A0A919PU70_9ACTN|nr:superoxide dismutase [Dactylosporangium siamense]GIG49356.1 hypothetical protein Dsi01nite_073970 [Dactylosporangium siamense]